MKSAAPKTYISKRMLTRYTEQRSEKLKSKNSVMAAKSAPIVPKSFTEDNSQSAAANSNLAVIEESKEEVKQNPAAAEQQNEMDKNLSAEELDSDELDGDLNLSDEEDGGARREEIRQQRAAAEENQAAPRERHNVEFDTNIFKVSLECLQNRG